MTTADVYFQIMAELSGKTVEFLRATCAVEISEQPLSDEKAADLLLKLRAEGPGIVNWGLAGLKRAQDRAGRQPAAIRPTPGES